MTRERDRIQENAKKYIVRNCPSCRYTPKRYIDGIDYICWNAQNFNSSAIGLCQDCTDCVTKQVIEKCKEYMIVLEMHKHNTKDCGFDNILQLFDIEEIRE